EEVVDRLIIHAIEHAYTRASAEAGPSHDVRSSVAVDVRGRHRHAATLARLIREERLLLGSGLAVEDADVRAAARASNRDDVGPAIPTRAPHRHEDSAHEAPGVSEPLRDQVAVASVEDADVRAAAGPGCRNHVVDAVAIDVANGRTHTAPECRVICI